MRNKQVKRETRMGEFSEICKEDVGIQLSQLPMAGQGMSSVLVQPLTSTLASFEDGNCLPSCRTQDGRDMAGNSLLFIPVQDKNGKPLMPCHPARARELIRKGRAVRRFLKGMFYIKLLKNITSNVQSVACGIDPGSKKEGFTVKSANHTYLNIQVDATTWVRDSIKTRREMRRGRRFRKTPCRQPRINRHRGGGGGGIPPSTKARWQWKLRISYWLSRLYPISVFIVEDVKAKTKGQRRWDKSFSPLEVGKAWFYAELSRIAAIKTKTGWETKAMRDALGLKKSGNKTAAIFEAHAVDSWVLAASEVGGMTVDNKFLLLITPLRFHRRQLHALQASNGGIRRPYGGTRSMGFRRGSLVKHPKYNVCFVGGTMNGKLSLHSIKDGGRLTQGAKPSECVALAYSSWRAVA